MTDTDAGVIPRRRTRWVGKLLRAGITVSLLVLLLRLVDLRAVAHLLRSVKLGWVLVGLSLYVVDRLLMFGKWFPLLRAQVPNSPPVPAARAYFASGIAQYVLPVTLGADVLRAAAIGRGQRVVAEVGASVAAERVLGLVASAVMSCLALGVAVREGLPLGVLLPWALLSVGAGAATMAVAFSPGFGRAVERWRAGSPRNRVLDFLRRFGSAFTSYRRHAGLLCLVALLSILEQWFPVALMWTAGRALEVPLSLAMVVVAMPLTLFVGRLPISLGGIGVGESAIVFLLGLFAVNTDDALAISVVCRAVDLAVTAVPGIFLWRDLVDPLRSPAVRAAKA